MERTMSVEERIKRAEEIYARRHEQEAKNTVYLNGKEKKDIKLFKKMTVQIVACLLIYLIVYTIRNNDYIFSEDFIKSANEILSNDTNFIEIYQNINGTIKDFFNKKEEKNTEEQIEKDNITEENAVEQNIGGMSEEKTKEEVLPLENQLSEEEEKILKVKNTAEFIKPVNGVISSKYGMRNPTTSSVPKNHTGTDIAANLGTKIISSTDGEVVIASSEGDYGIHLKIQIGEVSIIYAHCNKLYVNQGDKVCKGQEIAEVGSTGNSTGPHLHFEIRLNEETIDPEKILEL